MDKYESRILGSIKAEEINVGKGVIVEEGVEITGVNGLAEQVTLGDFCYIGRDVKIIVPSFRVGDYTKVHANSFLHGYERLQIGRNCWVGGDSILDSIGGLDIDDNVGIGGQSQIWTHIQFGDIVEGCRFYSKKYMHVGKDAWFVGHCIVSPVSIGEKSMALVGSVVTKDMLPNHVYAGVPAEDVSSKVGFQFEDRNLDQKAEMLQNMIDDFVKKYPQYKDQLRVIKSPDEKKDGVCCFDVSSRTYTKTYSQAEIAFLKQNVPLVKFVPDNEPFFLTK